MKHLNKDLRKQRCVAPDVKDQVTLMEEEIYMLKIKDAIIPINMSLEREGLFSTCFYFKDLNRTCHFKMEGIQSVRDLLLESDLLTRIKDARMHTF